MNYYQLKAILSSKKVSHKLKASSDSFSVSTGSNRPYIEPSFDKIIFESERPTIILVSAVGATGKTALAEHLSKDADLPLLNLTVHKPVGDNTLTGLVTHAFDVKDLTSVFSGLSEGTYGMIIDGVDEGRSKTTEKAFEAFLDDIVSLCKSSTNATIVMLGRTQVIDDCFTYLTDRGVATGLISISAFNLAEARKYIDAFTDAASGPYATQFVAARDAVLEKLGRVFAEKTDDRADDFLSFIGYPPVLDAIATLLREESNYHKLLQHIGTQEATNVEVSLLVRIAEYILSRERDQKVLPNIVAPLLQDAPEDIRKKAATIFSTEEQAVRLVGHCVNRNPSLAPFGESVIDDQYEARLATFLPEHPFIGGREFRNAVFEALALATLIDSRRPENVALAMEYLATHKHSYHLVYMLDVVSKDHRIPIQAVGALLTAAQEFRSKRSLVELHIGGPDATEVGTGATEIALEVEILLGEGEGPSQTFEFYATVTPQSRLEFGSRLGGAFITVPCPVDMRGAPELELTAPLEISASAVSLAASSLIIRSTVQKGGEQDVILSAKSLEARVETIVTNGVSLTFSLEDASGISYPAIQFVEKSSRAPSDPLLTQKYFRLKRILMEFRSHKKGSLAKYRKKIEHERVLKNEVGATVLRKLIEDGIVALQGSMYHLNPERLSALVGVTWLDLRKGKMPESLSKYLRSI